MTLEEQRALARTAAEAGRFVEAWRDGYSRTKVDSVEEVEYLDALAEELRQLLGEEPAALAIVGAIEGSVRQEGFHEYLIYEEGGDSCWRTATAAIERRAARAKELGR